MHSFIQFLYCCAADAPVPTPRTWFDAIDTMCQAVQQRTLPQYDTDPFVVISIYHMEHEKETMNLDEIMDTYVGGVPTSVWGPLAWTILHELARGPRFDRVTTLLSCWVDVLPCRLCRQHLATNLRDTHGFNTPQQAYEYTRALHNAVNTFLGKPLFVEPS